MTHISYQQLTKLAPSAARIKDRELAQSASVLDTNRFLRDLERDHGFKPYFAIQRPAHKDASTERSGGRHLVVAANPQTHLAIALLNCHYVDRRTWLGLGIACDLGEDIVGIPRGIFLTAHAMPILRGNAQLALESLLRYQREVKQIRTALKQFRPTLADLHEFAERVPSLSYMAGYKLPSTDFLKRSLTDMWSAGRPQPMLDVAAKIMRRLIVGNLPAEDPEGRNIKGVRSPDAILTASSGVLHAAISIDNPLLPPIEGLTRYAGKV